MRIMFAAFAALSLGACATQSAPSGPATLDVAPGQPAPVQARLYAGCVAQSAATQQYDREGNWIRFHCGGEIAHVFFDALGAYSARIHSEQTGGGRVWRFTRAMQRNPSGLDYCWRDEAGGYGCTVVLNAGDFLNQ
jgi:hypothetical protein